MERKQYTKDQGNRCCRPSTQAKRRWAGYIARQTEKKIYLTMKEAKIDHSQFETRPQKTFKPKCHIGNSCLFSLNNYMKKNCTKGSLNLYLLNTCRLDYTVFVKKQPTNGKCSSSTIFHYHICYRFSNFCLQCIPSWRNWIITFMPNSSWFFF